MTLSDSRHMRLSISHPLLKVCIATPRSTYTDQGQTTMAFIARGAIIFVHLVLSLAILFLMKFRLQRLLLF